MKNLIELGAAIFAAKASNKTELVAIVAKAEKGTKVPTRQFAAQQLGRGMAVKALGHFQTLGLEPVSVSANKTNTRFNVAFAVPSTLADRTARYEAMKAARKTKVENRRAEKAAKVPAKESAPVAAVQELVKAFSIPSPVVL
jgi:hypothetical protein